MNRSWAAAVLASAIASATASISFAQVKPPADPAPAARKAEAPAAQADVPVKQVVLFSSGVGYFEHYGTVAGNGSAELRFKTAQINDVLKSLVLQDLDKGQVGAVTYPSQEPIARTLRSFQVDITSNPTLADLLNQLRGAKINFFEIGALNRETRGATIVGVEKRQDRVGEKNQVVDYWVLNVKAGGRFRSVALNQISDFGLEDPKLEEELDKALSAVAQARDQDKKPVSIQFRGEGNRRVRIGYVVETPIWKTSYRLVLGKEEGEKKAAGGRPFTIEQAALQDPEVAEVLRTRIETFLRLENLEASLHPTGPGVSKAKNELAALDDKLNRMVQEFNAQRPDGYRDDAPGGAVVAVVKDGDRQWEFGADSLSAYRADLTRQREILAELSNRGIAHPAVVRLKSEVRTMQRVLDAIENNPNPGQPVVLLADAPAKPTDAQIKSMQTELEAIKGWAEGMDPQYGGPHPAVVAVRARQKELEAALKDGRLPKDVPALPKQPIDAGDRKNLEDEIEVLKIWFPGMESGYGKDHPAIVWARNHIAAVEKLLNEPEPKKVEGPEQDRAARLARARHEREELEVIRDQDQQKLCPPEKVIAALRQRIALYDDAIHTLQQPVNFLADAKAAVPAKPNSIGKLQGWAIVENQTDNDWTDVQLSLVSGRPLSYIQDLYNPLYVPRPVVYPNLIASLRPQTYTGGISEQEEKKLNDQRNAQQAQQQAQNENLGRGRGWRNAGGGQGGGGGGGLFGAGAKRADAPNNDLQSQSPLDPTASVASAASAAQLGELFEYTVGNVTLPRQKSAMIPIVTDDISVEKVSIYNESVLARYPLNGVKIKNTTDKHLLSGPVTVLEAGSYAGDARLDDVPPGQSRLLSYGIDLSVLVDAEEQKDESTVRAGKIVKGVLFLTRKEVQQQTYAIQNKGKSNRTLIIEHPREEGWTLVEPAKFEEKTDQVFRFRTTSDAGKTEKFSVRLERVDNEEFRILDLNDGLLLQFSTTDSIPEPVRKVLAEVASRHEELTTLQTMIEERKKQIAEVTAEQNRIRDNMKTVAQNTDYYNRLLKKLDEQETSIEKIQKESAELQKERETKGKQLEAFVAGLNVG